MRRLLPPKRKTGLSLTNFYAAYEQEGLNCFKRAHIVMSLYAPVSSLPSVRRCKPFFGIAGHPSDYAYSPSFLPEEIDTPSCEVVKIPLPACRLCRLSSLSQMDLRG